MRFLIFILVLALSCNFKGNKTPKNIAKIKYDSTQKLHFYSHIENPKQFPTSENCMAIQNRDTILVNIAIRGIFETSILEILKIKNTLKAQLIRYDCTSESIYLAKEPDSLVVNIEGDKIRIYINSEFNNTQGYKYFVQGFKQLIIKDKLTYYPLLDNLRFTKLPKPIKIVN